MKVLIAGGGTVGHLAPGLALAQELQRRGDEVTFAGSASGPEARMVPEAGFNFEPLRISGRGSSALSSKNLIAIWRLASSTARSMGFIRRMKPHAVVGTGGYASLPVALASAVSRTPLVVHEQNAVPGLANRVASRFAVAVAASFPGSESQFGTKGHLIGNPVRDELLHLDRAASRSAALHEFGLEDGRVTLLVTGGSQGASSINAAVIGAYDSWRSEGRLQVLHLTGEKNLDQVMQRVAEMQRPGDAVLWRSVGFATRMDFAYAAADLAVTRAGASTIAELAAVGLPAVLVPLPHSIDDDQRRNADAVARGGGAVVLEDEGLTEHLRDLVARLIFDEGKLAAMSEALALHRRPNAASDLADLVVSVARRS